MLGRRGYDVWCYSSLEQQIVRSGAARLDALEGSRKGWRRADHCIWPWIDYFAAIMADAYLECERQFTSSRKTGLRSKQERVIHHVLDRRPQTFRISDIRHVLPDVSDATIRLALTELKRDGVIELLSPGRDATWRRVDGSTERRLVD